MSFWSGYWRSLKPLEVEEPIDVWVHRPLAYVLARALYPTKVSPNAVTAVSIVFGLAAGAAFLSGFSGHLQLAGGAVFVSAVFDCADGQLARLRGTSSALGRMLDGIADLVVSTAAVGGSVWVLWRTHHEPWWLGALVLLVAALTAATSACHTALYDHYKNVFLRLTSPGYVEGEDYESALERHRDRLREGWGARLAWPVYMVYLRAQLALVRHFDPYTTSRLSALPTYDPERARVYRQHAQSTMRLWRGWFGFGSLLFGLALAAVLDALELYVAYRLLGLNLVLFGYLRARQRAASRDAFGALGLAPLRTAG